MPKYENPCYLYKFNSIQKRSAIRIKKQCAFQ